MRTLQREALRPSTENAQELPYHYRRRRNPGIWRVSVRVRLESGGKWTARTHRGKGGSTRVRRLSAQA
eukprot:9692249-Alexandrium_andersonii.AAC.1